jgi:molecular chaperone DnaJ
VQIGVYIPENLSREEKETFEKLKQSENMKPGATAKNNFFNRFKKMFE